MIFSKYKKTLPKNHDKTKVYQKFVDEYLPNIEKTRAPNRERSLASKVEEDKARTIRQSGLRKEALAFATTDRMKGFSGGFNAWLAKLTETDDTAFWDDMGGKSGLYRRHQGLDPILKSVFCNRRRRHHRWTTSARCAAMTVRSRPLIYYNDNFGRSAKSFLLRIQAPFEAASARRNATIFR